MTRPIEDYALIGNAHTAALVSRAGSIDWMCAPRFDSGACFAALLGDRDNGFWSIAPKQEPRRISRHYRPDTLILETTFETDSGSFTLIDLMPLADRVDRTDVIRLVRGDRGEVAVNAEIVFRFDYGSVVPWLERCTDGVRVAAGPDAMRLRTSVPLRNENFRTFAEWTVREGETTAFQLSWLPSSHRGDAAKHEPLAKLEATEAWWRDWAQNCNYTGKWRDQVVRSLITLKALTYAPTGGTVAAATTSLPELLGGPRNWDYRFCWMRDATFLFYALLSAGYTEEAAAWRDWLFRAVAGKPSQLQIMYGIAGERRLIETELDWLAGYAGSCPVRTGNAAYGQRQLDVYGEIMDAFYVDRTHDVPAREMTRDLVQVLMERLGAVWAEPDHGIWEVRGEPRHFTHSKVMAWVAADRAVKLVERFDFPGDSRHWAALRQRIHDQVCDKGFDRERNTFTQYYGGDTLDAALLMLPMLGFIAPDDPRMRGTIDAIRDNLTVDGFVQRYNHGTDVDGFAVGEGVFLPCSFWLVDNLAMRGETEAATEMFERLLEVCNDVGLLSEEYDPRTGRLLGNFPQALSHVALVNSAFNLTRAEGPAENRKAK